jgi:hypothetical protein
MPENAPRVCFPNNRKSGTLPLLGQQMLPCGLPAAASAKSKEKQQ